MTAFALEFEVPLQAGHLRMPAALRRRLKRLLDKQDGGAALSRAERAEAEALVDLIDLLTLIRLRAKTTR